MCSLDFSDIGWIKKGYNRLENIYNDSLWTSNHDKIYRKLVIALLSYGIRKVRQNTSINLISSYIMFKISKNPDIQRWFIEDIFTVPIY